MGSVLDIKRLFRTGLRESILTGDLEDTKQWLDLAQWSSKELPEFLLVAVSVNQPMIVNELLKRKVDINYKDTLGNTALSLAIRFNFTEIVNRLLEFSTSVINTPNDSGWTPLHFAALNTSLEGDLSIYDKLLIMGADYCVEAQGKDAATILRLNSNGMNQEMNPIKDKIAMIKNRFSKCQVNAMQNIEKRKSVLNTLMQHRSVYMSKRADQRNSLSQPLETNYGFQFFTSAESSETNSATEEQLTTAYRF